MYDCESELKEKLFVKTVCKGNTSWYPSKRNLRTSSSDLSSDWLRLAGGLKMRFTGTLQKASNQPREPETDTQREKEREREKGSPNLLLQLAVCLKKEKKNCCAQCLFVGKISASCTYNSFALGFMFV